MKFEELSQKAQTGIEKFRKFILSLDDSKYEFIDVDDWLRKQWHAKYADVQIKDDRGLRIDLPGIFATFLLQENIFSSEEILNALDFAKDKNYWCDK